MCCLSFLLECSFEGMWGWSPTVGCNFNMLTYYLTIDWLALLKLKDCIVAKIVIMFDYLLLICIHLIEASHLIILRYSINHFHAWD